MSLKCAVRGTIRAFSKDGAEIKDSFRNYEGIISGSPSRISVDEKSELSRIVRGVSDRSIE
jgi:circadian clock protein KaiC